jgi:hypothetical protein
MAEYNNDWDAFSNWMILSKEEKERLNLPLTTQDYSFANKISDRTLRRWKKDPMFIALTDKKASAKNRKLGIVVESAKGTPTLQVEEEEPGDQQDTPESEYQVIKGTLVKGAMTGDAKYLDLYFKTYGKDFVAEESAARTSDLASIDMSDLILQALEAISCEEIVAYLIRQGYSVSRDSGGTSE